MILKHTYTTTYVSSCPIRQTPRIRSTTASHAVQLAGAPHASTAPKQQHRSSVCDDELSQQQTEQQQGSQCSSLTAALPAAALLTLPLATWAGDAAAATVCVDVPDWLVDWRASLIHSPVVAVGAAGLALVLFPKLIRTAINYLAIPAILAMLAYAAVSFPEQTANSVYAVLEFVKEHPTASSIGIIVGAGALLGPDLLAGTAVAGVLVLLGVKLGILQMPQLPQLPKVPGQALLARQLDRAGNALRERLDDLDDDDDDGPGGGAGGKGGGGRGTVRGDLAVRQSKYSAAASSQPVSVQSAPPTAVTAADAQALPAAPPAAMQQQEQQQPGPAAAAVKGFAQQLGAGAKALTSTALTSGKAAGGAVLQQGKLLVESGAVQELSQQTAEAAGKAAQGAKQLISSAWQRGQQALPGGLQALQQDTAAGQAAAEAGAERAPVVARSQQEVDAILANS